VIKKTKMTGHTCVEDFRLAPIDVGLDLKILRAAVILPESFTKGCRKAQML